MTGPSHCGRSMRKVSRRVRAGAGACASDLTVSSLISSPWLAAVRRQHGGRLRTPGASPRCPARGDSDRLHHPLLLPLGEDAPTLGIGLLEGVLGCGGTA